MEAMEATYRPGSKSIAPKGLTRAGALIFLVSSAFLSACSDSSTGDLTINQPDGLVLSPPDFLQGRAIVQSNLTPRVTVVADGVNFEAVQTNSTSAPWIGQVFVPQGSNPIVDIMWVEKEVAGLPADYNGELPLAVTTIEVDNIVVNEAMEVTTDQYITRSTERNPQPLLDIDNDGASNIEERQAGSRPGDQSDIPSSVLILYNDRSPIIDGQFDSIWNTAQFRDQDVEELEVENLLINNGVVDLAVADDFRWAAMHDGTYLYVMVFAERGINQTPVGDSGEVVYQDDAVDIYWDGDNSKGASYDGIDDHHIIVALLAENGAANNSSSADSRIQVGDNSVPIDSSAIEYAVCLCNGDQQIYEFRLELAALSIPIDSTFGFEVNINNDADGAVRDAKWAWFNDTGIDDTWRFPLRMGNVRLEPLP